MEGQTENFTPGGQLRPWVSKFSPRGEVKNGPEMFLCKNGPMDAHNRPNFVARPFFRQKLIQSAGEKRVEVSKYRPMVENSHSLDHPRLHQLLPTWTHFVWTFHLTFTHLSIYKESNVTRNQFGRYLKKDVKISNLKVRTPEAGS
jgi:hypothetical protein